MPHDLSVVILNWNTCADLRKCLGSIFGQAWRSAVQVVVADNWFIPQNAPYAFADKIWLLAEDAKPMFNLIQLLRKTTAEPAMLYASALTWAHIDPQVLMGPRILEQGEPTYVDAHTQYFEISRYLLLK
jgi:hypothetical protein